MKVTKIMLGVLLLAGTFGAGAASIWGAEGVISKVQMTGTNYCHMKFPAIREETLSWDRPVLKNDGDIIDFYGPCNYDPLGKDAIQAQKLDQQRRWSREYAD